MTSKIDVIYCNRYYIPLFGLALLEKFPDINMGGIAMGNPWIDPQSHHDSYVEMGIKHGWIHGPQKNTTRSMESIIGDRNVYDIRLLNDDDYPPGINKLEAWLSGNPIFGNATWQVCSDDVYTIMRDKLEISTLKEIGMLLTKRIRVVIFSGEYDFICNSIGTLKASIKIPWRASSGYALSPENRLDWGSVKSHSYLTHISNIFFWR